MSTDPNTNARAVATVASASRSQWDRVSQGLGSSATSASGRVKVVASESSSAVEPALEPPPVAAHAFSARARFDAVPWERGAAPVTRSRPVPVAPPEPERATSCTAQDRFSRVPWEEGLRARPVGPSAAELEELARAAEARASSMSISSFFHDAKW